MQNMEVLAKERGMQNIAGKRRCGLATAKHNIDAFLSRKENEQERKTKRSKITLGNYRKHNPVVARFFIFRDESS